MAQPSRLITNRDKAKVWAFVTWRSLLNQKEGKGKSKEWRREQQAQERRRGRGDRVGCVEDLLLRLLLRSRDCEAAEWLKGASLYLDAWVLDGKYVQQRWANVRARRLSLDLYDVFESCLIRARRRRGRCVASAIPACWRKVQAYAPLLLLVSVRVYVCVCMCICMHSVK